MIIMILMKKIGYALYVTCVTTFTLTCFVQSKKPYMKKQQAIWQVECELGIIVDPDCPIDGAWAPWGPWSPCHGPCDEIGHRTRTRSCNNPAPSNDGMPCNGPDEKVEPCYITNCTVEDYRKLVEGDSTRSEAMHQLETVPALMERCLQTECPYEAIEGALSSDNTWDLNPEALWNSLQCVKHNMGCPVMGEWGNWGVWSACGARCGRGIRWRLRRCDAPPPSDGNFVCDSTPLQSEKCEGDQCAIEELVEEKNVGGTWSNWGQWSICSEKCGVGVRRRRRICNEKQKPPASGTWGTHCPGQHDQLEVCDNAQCILNGGWSGWTRWGQCSRTCGAGKRSRTRSCTRPTPSGGGTACIGPRIEIGSCYLAPCEVYSHVVAVLNGESFLQYNFRNKRSTLFHFYMRFMPLSPHGTLVCRGKFHDPHVRLSLHRWHVCLDASGLSKSCNLQRICSHIPIEPEVWHSVLITVTNEAASLRLNDAQIPIRSTFPCEPEFREQSVDILIGERFYGEIQEIIFNFIPLNMLIERKKRNQSTFYPTLASNVAFQKANIEEAYLTLDTGQYLRLPCFEGQEEWRLELTIKPRKEAGTILFMNDDKTDRWFLLALQNMRLKVKLALEDFRSESISSTEFPPDQWLDITLTKKINSNSVEACINAGERLHVVLEVEKLRRRRRQFRKPVYENVTESSTSTIHNKYLYKYNQHILKPQDIKRNRTSYIACHDEFYVGGVTAEIKRLVPEEFTPFSGSIASVIVNRVLQDLHAFSVERYKDDKLQVSSRTASVSGSYHETVWGRSNRLNLTCLHARTGRSPHSASWLLLDTGISGTFMDRTVRSIDDGRVLRLVASAENDLRGFYTCRAHALKRTLNIVTYGVLGKIQHKLTGPDTMTGIAVITTLTLVIGTLAWLIIEGINDLQNGFGFFRDCHLSPQEEAEAVCSYIDQNVHLIGLKNAAKAKAKAKRKARRLASRSSFAAQEPQGLLQIKRPHLESPSEPDSLPALPAINSSVTEPSHDVYRCEPCYVSSPRHGSNITSPRANLSSSSSFQLTSPRVLCSRLLMSNGHSSRESVISRKISARTSNGPSSGLPRKAKCNLLTIKSSTYINQSPAQKILQKFQQLKRDDS